MCYSIHVYYQGLCYVAFVVSIWLSCLVLFNERAVCYEYLLLTHPPTDFYLIYLTKCEEHTCVSSSTLAGCVDVTLALLYLPKMRRDNGVLSVFS